MSEPQDDPGQSTRGRWFSMRAASEYLGVDQSTLRRWSDEGRVPVFLTPGGHRRYAEDDLARMVEQSTHRPRQRPKVTRQELTDRSLSAYADEYLQEARERDWFRSFGAALQEEHRLRGRRLVDLAIRYAASTGTQGDRARLLEDAREIGAWYGRSNAAAGMSSSAAVEAFLYFRLPVVRAVLGVIEERGLAARRASRMFVRIDDFIDQVLLAMVQAYEEANGTPAR